MFSKKDYNIPRTVRLKTFYESVNANARKAIDAWTVVARRLGVVKDMRRLIGGMVWSDRHVWMHATEVPPETCTCRWHTYQCMRVGCMAVFRVRAFWKDCAEHTSAGMGNCPVCTGASMALPAEAA